MYEPIIDALRRGAHAEASEAARRLIADHPDDARAHQLHAYGLRGAGEFDAAGDALDRALRLAPDNADLHVDRAMLLLARRDTDGSALALAKATELDPNQFSAYALQAQLALGRGDLEKAEQQLQLAARVAPEHPWTLATAGAIALQRGDAAAALVPLTQALQADPDDPLILQTLALAYLGTGAIDFAEQALARVIALQPGSVPPRMLRANILARNDAPADALETLAPLLEREPGAAVQRLAGQLHLMLGDVDAAMPLLQAALARAPHDPDTLQALMHVWSQPDQHDAGRERLAEATAAHPTAVPLWQARLALAPDADAAYAIVRQWVAAQPGELVPLEARLMLEQQLERMADADRTAASIRALQPGRTVAELHVLDRLIAQDPHGAVIHVETLMSKAQNTDAAAEMKGWLAYAQDAAGLHGDAVRTWSEINAKQAARRMPLHAPTGVVEVPGRPVAPPGDVVGAKAFLYGVPGGGVADVAAVIAQAGYPLLTDRLGAQPPDDAFQRDGTAAQLQSGALAAGAAMTQWRDALPARGARDGFAIDLLLWWDNAVVPALQTQVPDGFLLAAIRDPRQMLIEWLAFGDPVPFAVPPPLQAAEAIAAQCRQLQALHASQAYPTLLLRTDTAKDDPEAFAAEVGSALGLQEIRVPAAAALASRHFAPGHWRAYRAVLAEPFALLTPCAVALGYPAS